jgi:hypothetical protein
MAGAYPDAPGSRIAYDRDGTTGATITTTNSITSLTAGQISNLNDEDADAVTYTASGYIVLFFPVPMTIIGSFHAANTSVKIETSSDTTTGIDGTWTQFRAFTGNTTISPAYRTTIYLAGSPVTGVTAMRFQNNLGGGTPTISVMHLYGYPDSDSDRLEFWHPTLDQPLRDTPAYFDYGDVSRGSGAIARDFRIKNLSTSLTANTITVGCEAPTDSTPTYVSQTEFRYNGGSYAGTATLGSLAPNTISNTFTAKLDVLASATMGPWAQRYYADAASWS